MNLRTISHDSSQTMLWVHRVTPVQFWRSRDRQRCEDSIWNRHLPNEAFVGADTLSVPDFAATLGQQLAQSE